MLVMHWDTSGPRPVAHWVVTATDEPAKAKR